MQVEAAQAPDYAHAVRLERIGVRYGHVVALSSIKFRVGAPKIGDNGAGRARTTGQSV
jgi:ABC-type sugar transport system ATPase subunit